jgi:hypothetical protein
MGFCVRISILSKEAVLEGAYEAFVDIKIVEKIRGNQSFVGDSVRIEVMSTS